MNSPKAKDKKGLISKTWERCKSFTSGRVGRKGSNSSGNNQLRVMMKSKSWPRHDSAANEEKKNGKKWNNRVAPEGCLSIYVGPQKERFVIKTEYVNHPLFKLLLEEAESEYGYSSEGPLMLPCEVDRFIEVLMEILESEENISINIGKQQQQAGCNFVVRSHTSYHLLTPPTLLPINTNFKYS